MSAGRLPGASLRGRERRILRVDRVVTPASVLSPGFVVVLDGLIDFVGAVLPPGFDAAEVEHVTGTALPGFVDQHVHGALGIDFGSATAADALRVVDYHAARGSTSLVASVATAPLSALEQALDTLAPLVGFGHLAGIHLEGPFLSAARRGAHDASLLVPPTVEALSRLVDAAAGSLRMVTLAPELPGGLDAVSWLVERGITVALGHSDCDAATATAAFDRGATVVTHLFNGMRPLHHREPGLVGAALDDDRVSVELILDGHHVAGSVAALVRRLAPDRLVLVSDAMSATGLGDGSYAIAGSAVTVTDGVAMLADGSSLAGSTATVGDALVRLAELSTARSAGAASAPSIAVEAAAVTSGSASRGLGLVPPLSPGAPADLVIVDNQTFGVERVLRRGTWLSVR
jgi:N-acetylglucosamine-6-phosphate deacetylase